VELTSSITIGQYLPRASVIHRLDPRTKILITGGLTVILFFVPSFQGMGLFAAALLLLLVVGQIPLGYALRGLRPLVFLLLLTASACGSFFWSSPRRCLRSRPRRWN
jgi:energy-coupling factor transport system permease protein